MNTLAGNPQLYKRQPNLNFKYVSLSTLIYEIITPNKPKKITLSKMSIRDKSYLQDVTSFYFDNTYLWPSLQNTFISDKIRAKRKIETFKHIKWVSSLFTVEVG